MKSVGSSKESHVDSIDIFFRLVIAVNGIIFSARRLYSQEYNGIIKVPVWRFPIRIFKMFCEQRGDVGNSTCAAPRLEYSPPVLLGMMRLIEVPSTLPSEP